jgi:hypothetical protein
MQERFLKNEFDTATALKIALRPEWWQLQNHATPTNLFRFYETTNLYNAKFDKTDCKTCQFNSNCNSLFETDGDQCYNEKCFNDKTAQHQEAQLVEAISKYDYFINDSWQAMNKNIVKRLEDAGKVVLQTRDLFELLEEPEKPEFDEDEEDEAWKSEKMEEYNAELNQYKEKMKSAIPCFVFSGSNYSEGFMLLRTKDRETVANSSSEGDTNDPVDYLKGELERTKTEKERYLNKAKQQFQHDLDAVFYENRKEIVLRVKDKQFVSEFLRPAQNYFINEVKGLYNNIEIGEITFFEAVMLYVIDHMVDCRPEEINLPLVEQMAKIADPEKFLELEGKHMNKTESSIKNFDERIKMLETKIADAKK